MPSNPLNWKDEFKTALRTVEQLLEHGLITRQEAPKFKLVLDKFSLFLPLYYASLIDRKDPLCPIRKQALPDLKELDASQKGDPLGDLKHQPAPRITHRYTNRALLHLTVNCPMYCRYCFRKTLLNADSDRFFQGEIKKAFEYLKNNPAIEEVILSGGDPLMVSDSGLKEVFIELSKVPHLKRIRIHSRAPVTLPSRIDAELISTFQASLLPIVFVTHFNHPKELTAQAKQACKLLSQNTAGLLNQSVLMAGINAEARILKKLSEELFEAKVMPYYLHQMDPALGTRHFGVSLELGREIFHQLRLFLPGYLVPRYVQDSGDGNYKTLL